MCWTVTYVYSCGCVSITTFKCLQCPDKDDRCAESETVPAQETCLDERCHDCSELDVLVELAADLAVEGDRLILPLQTSRLANLLGSDVRVVRPLQPLQTVGN
ncbi:hypothetical protein NKR23_g10131 [Pleurostoma richardsiae]|uniref:Uncharacterized protein n=1 Tax=Pleurostoma richardsiae TaxID=41990 RepID=A0AA38RDL8_9PEZI|nr:hypothetical protein NKR23_g10131 [Pleurostoma richardsiae]